MISIFAVTMAAIDSNYWLCMDRGLHSQSTYNAVMCVNDIVYSGGLW